MKIGVGISTYNRPKHLDLFLKQLKSYTSTDYQLHIADDSNDRKGIAYRKNESLRILKDCDYIFLFDDDCFPIKEGWVEWFIEQHKASGQHHFLYLRETSTINKVGEHIGQENIKRTIENYKVIWSIPILTINEYNNCAGCFMFLTKEVIEKVGAFGEYPFPYGYEHAAYSQRIHKAGLTPMGNYLCPIGIDEYIYPMDYRSDLLFNKQINHSPSIEVDKVNEYIKGNQEAYFNDIKIIYKPL